MITTEKIKEFEDLKDRINKFIESNIPIKTSHSDSIERYFDRFIKFPGAIGIISIFFSNSEIVKSPKVAMAGTVLITISILVALNVFRKQINIDKKFIDKVNEIEVPMVEFSRNLTVFSREQSNKEKEDILINSYNKIQKMYDENPLGDDSKKDNSNNIYKAMNLSFGMLALGISLSILSILFCF